MAKTLKELLDQYGHNSIGDADMALGHDNPGALETILQERQNWANAGTKEERDAAHTRAENIRKAYGQYSGGVDGMDGQYKPTYQKPATAAENDNVMALYDKFNNLYGKQNAPTWTPQYQEQISQILGEISGRDPFEYNMNEDPLYQQFRDQYIREGQRAMRDSAAQSAAMTGGYGSTYGAIAAQQAYDQYLAGLNDKVPQLEQMAYGKWTDELADLYNQMGAYQSEENRLYGQRLDALDQFNIDRDYAFNAMQAAIAQNNQENQFNRGIFETDRAFNQDFRQADISNAAAFGDWDKVEGYDYDVNFMRDQQAMEQAQMAYNQMKLAQQTGKLQGTAGNSSGGSGGNKTKQSKTKEKTESGYSNGDAYARLLAEYMKFGDTAAFDSAVRVLLNKGIITESDYNKFAKQFG